MTSLALCSKESESYPKWQMQMSICFYVGFYVSKQKKKGFLDFFDLSSCIHDVALIFSWRGQMHHLHLDQPDEKE